MTHSKRGVTMRPILLLAAVLLSSAAWAAPHHAAQHHAALRVVLPPPPPATPYDECEAAIGAAERAQAIPPRILPAIGRVESGRPDPAEKGRVRPWPWTIDVEGQGQSFATKEEAVAAVQALQARGVRSIDVGCMQVNLLQHSDAFASLDAAFDPTTNAAYGARFLAALFRQTGNWPMAVADYHSQTPELGIPYQQRVMAGLPGWDPLALPGGVIAVAGKARLAGPYAAWPPAGTTFAAFAPKTYTFGAFAPAPDLALATLMSGRKRLTILPASRRTTQVAELPAHTRSR
jgi:hypothetical protein